MTTPVEDRLRAVLERRAERVTAGDLRPAALPSRLLAPAARPGVRLPWRSPWAPRRARWVPVLAGVAVTALVVVFAVVFAWRPQQPAPPDRAPYLPGEGPASRTAPTPADLPSGLPNSPPITSPTPQSSDAVSSTPWPVRSTPFGTTLPGAAIPGSTVPGASVPPPSASAVSGRAPSSPTPPAGTTAETTSDVVPG